MYKGTPIRLSKDFSAEILQTRKWWNDIFKVLKEIKTANQEYSTWKSYFSELKERESFQHKLNLNNFMNTRLIFKKCKGSSST